ncbi:MAG: hypothetical protein K6T16_02275 [Candidatus Pacearchaeota archaeon]|nr:hypothetical protein [Candidatus Pacearchaeota archaeon]
MRSIGEQARSAGNGRPPKVAEVRAPRLLVSGGSKCESAFVGEPCDVGLSACSCEIKSVDDPERQP